jgi:cell division septal protein FtsQ
MPVAAPADKRFRRAHVSPKARRGWRESLPTIARLSVACAVVLLGAWRLGNLAMRSEALTVTRITVSGNSRMSRGEVLSVLDDLRGTNMLTVSLDVWREKLLASPWVADAALRREFPGTVAVTISERQPLAIGRINDMLYLIDQRGAIIDEYGPNYAELDLPIIDGLGSGSSADPSNVDGPRAVLVGRLLSDLQRRPDLAARVSQIDVSDLNDAVIVLKDDTALVRVGDDHFVERLQSYVDLAPALKERIPNIDYVDLRFDERVYVRPLGAGGRAERVSARKDS